MIERVSVVSNDAAFELVWKAYAEAQAVLAEQSQFRLPDKQWREFCKALDTRPKDIPALRKLLTEPSVFDE